MNHTDLLYRAFTDYRKNTTEDVTGKKNRDAIRTAGADRDRLEAIRSHCVIEEDWVNTINQYLPYVEKAIREERQFIRQEGEVLPIEKTKHVSKDSVEHLARHSDMITHVPEEGADLIPDKLYVVEKLSDFAVYENRFLYMLLCYLRDFIEIRYEKIVEIGHLYRAELSIHKEIRVGKRKIKFRTEMSEEAKNDPFSDLDRSAMKLLETIEGQRHIVSALLLTPLMKEVSHSPMIKPPITRTNALRMDNNFKNALALYDYLSAYQKDGYTIETFKKTYGPFPEEMGDEFAELVELTSHLTYCYGKEIHGVLRHTYEEEEKRKREEQANRQKNKIRELKRRIAEEGMRPEEYMLLLEERNRSLEADREKLALSESRMASLEETVSQLKARQKELLSQLDALQTESADKDARMEQMSEAHHTAMEEASRAHTLAMAQQTAESEEKHRSTVASFEEELRRQKQEYEKRLDAQGRELGEQLTQARAEAERSEQEIVVLRAELHAQRKLNGSIAEEGDFTSKERFEELEREYRALGALLEGQWKKTKKQIRRRVLWNKDSEDTGADGDKKE